jgi:hypothetical protein
VKDCMQSRLVRADCDKCGKRPEVLHMPTNKHGWFCEAHCPVCSRAAIRPTIGNSENQSSNAPGARPQAAGR